MALGACLAAALLAGSAPCAPDAAAVQPVLIGGGSSGGVYTLAARQICALVNEHIREEYGCIARPAPGAVFNIRAIGIGLTDFGFTQSDRNHEALIGLAAWDGKPREDLRSVFSLYPETVLLVTRADAGIADVADLKGRTVSIGTPGTGPRGHAEDVLRLYGIDRKREIETRSLRPGDAARALVDGTIDAFFCTVGNPAAAIAQAADAADIALVPIDSEAVGAFVAARPYYVVAMLPPGTYRGVAAPVATYAATATMVTGADVAEELVYDIVRAVFMNLDVLRSAHPALQGLAPAAMLQGLSAPLHPGAARYYREQGWL